jgi:DNA transformation protein
MVSHEYRDYVMFDLLGGMDDITTKPMFGGHALYKKGVIFGIIIDDILYFKVDERNHHLYEKAESKPFTYMRGKKSYAMSYFEVPHDILEDREKLEEYVETSTLINEDIQAAKNKKKLPKKNG